MKYILAIDQGTTATTVLLIDHKLNIVAKCQTELTQHYPQLGWVEHDPQEIWTTTHTTIQKCLSQARIKGDQIAAMGITNQRETTILWDRRSGQPVHRALVWQDRRTTDICHSLKRKGLEQTIRKKTGLVIDPYFSATKVQWLLKNVALARDLATRNLLCFGTVDSFLVWKFTGGAAHVTDVTNASRTLLMNLKTLAWDSALLKIFGVPASCLPKICSNAEVFGFTKNVPGLKDGIPIAGMAGDQQAALFGQACFEAGEAKCTYGTGSFLLLNTGSQPVFSKKGLLTTVAWKMGERATYALEGSSFIAGAAVQWLRDGLKLIKSSSEIEALAQTVPDNGGVSFVPAFVGLGSPYWNPDARGLISGITRGTQTGHIARAALESIAFSQRDILDVMQRESRKKLKKLKVDGGASVNNLLMQFQADLLNCDIVRPQIVETTALGSALFAGIAVGFWSSSDEIRQHLKIDKIFSPSFSPQSRKKYLSQWKQAIRKTVCS